MPDLHPLPEVRVTDDDETERFPVVSPDDETEQDTPAPVVEEPVRWFRQAELMARALLGR